MKVTDPSGQVWRVSRRWVPWRRRLKGNLDSGPDLGSGFDGLGDDPISLILAVILLILLLPFILLLVVAGIEFLLLLLVLPFAVLGRVLLGRHWHVELRKGWKPWWETAAGDWQASGVRIHEIADAVRRGHTPTATLGDEAGRG